MERSRRHLKVAQTVASRFLPGPRRCWSHVPDVLWNDWHWQQRERVTRLEQLERVIRVTPDERPRACPDRCEFHMGITPYYAALMDPEDPTAPSGCSRCPPRAS